MSETFTIQGSLRLAASLLGPRSEAAALESEILLAHVLAVPRSHLRTWPEKILHESQRHYFFDLVARRAAGEPIAYITGRREFWSLDLVVDPTTLIPRPETELLVEAALERIAQNSEAYIADLGTGSGAIALAIASERPRCRVIATDLSPRSLNVARENARRLNLSNVEFREGSWFAPLGDLRFDMIVSNPPYVAEDDPHLAEGDLPAEPRRALVAGPTGLEIITALIKQAPPYLREEGWLLMEHGRNQAMATAALLHHSAYQHVQTWRDIAGNDRVSGGRRG
jgi:release factor glutamine methyltransferase